MVGIEIYFSKVIIVGRNDRNFFLMLNLLVMIFLLLLRVIKYLLLYFIYEVLFFIFVWSFEKKLIKLKEILKIS